MLLMLRCRPPTSPRGLTPTLGNTALVTCYLVLARHGQITCMLSIRPLTRELFIQFIQFLITWLNRSERHVDIERNQHG